MYFWLWFWSKSYFSAKNCCVQKENPREKMLWAEWKRQLNIKLANQEKEHLQWKNKLKTTMHNVVIAMHRRVFFKFYSNCKLKNSKKHVCKVVISALQTTLLGVTLLLKGFFCHRLCVFFFQHKQIIWNSYVWKEWLVVWTCFESSNYPIVNAWRHIELLY